MVRRNGRRALPVRPRTGAAGLLQFLDGHGAVLAGRLLGLELVGTYDDLGFASRAMSPTGSAQPRPRRPLGLPSITVCAAPAGRRTCSAGSCTVASPSASAERRAPLTMSGEPGL